jgi:hypothetical protein
MIKICFRIKTRKIDKLEIKQCFNMKKCIKNTHPKNYSTVFFFKNMSTKLSEWWNFKMSWAWLEDKIIKLKQKYNFKNK